MINDEGKEGRRRDATRYLQEAFDSENHIPHLAFRMTTNSVPVLITKELILTKTLEHVQTGVEAHTAKDAAREAINDALYELIAPFPIDSALNPEAQMIYSLERLHKALKRVVEKYGEGVREEKAGEVRAFKPPKKT